MAAASEALPSAMSEPSSEPLHELTSDQLGELLRQAREARAALQLPQGLALAAQVWAAAEEQGFLSEQIEAGYLRVFFLVRQGALAEMLRAGEAAVALMREQGPSEQLCEVLRWMTLSSFETGDFEQSMRCAHEGCSVAQRLGNTRQIALSLNALAAVFERMGDPWQAERLMGEAAALVRDGDFAFERMISLNNLSAVALGAFYLLRDGDRLEQAQQALLRGRDYATEAHALAQAAGDPFSSVLTSGNLGEVDLHLGELEEAEALLRPALKLALEHGLQAHVWRLRCALAELSLMRGNATRAHQGMSALLADLTDVASVPTRLRVHTLMYRACKALNLTAEALLHLEALHQMERRSSTVQLEAQSRFFVTRLEAEQARLLAEHRHAAAPQPASGAESAPDELDPLTGLRNRRHLESTMPGLMRSAEAREAALTLALIDVDHMKQVNTEFGYAAGDQVLQRLADMLRDNTRGSDILVRMDGEEFLVVFPDTVADRAFEVCERLREHVELHPWQDVAPGLHVTLSIGLASAPPYGTDLLTGRAQNAMYRAKHLGMNRVALA
jgi:diguanylate cyclase (GGDEF)-like protein